MEKKVGSVYGELEILATYRSKTRYVMCHCLCSCGNTSEVFYSNLKSGRTKSCGHLEKQNRERYKDLTGEDYGELTVTRATSKRKEGTIVWECACSCGRSIEASRRQLIRGYITSCGHHKDDHRIGEIFGELTVLEVSRDKKRVYCKCSCGNTKWLFKYNVLNGHTKSCGHLLKKDNFKRIDGVVLATLHKKLSSKNTSGYTGVSQTRDGKWVSYITFKNKRYTLGLFKDIESAIEARARAEKKLYTPVLEKEKLSK